MISYPQINDHLIKVEDVIDTYPIKHWDEPTVNAISIGAPEIIRYNLFSDFLETQSLELLYVNCGTDCADFSIGIFQMKPSFIEDLENTIQCNPSLSEFSHLAKYPSSKIEEIRKNRISRISNPHYQLWYLKAFYQYSYSRHSSYLEGLCQLDRQALIATHYNMGINSSLMEIIEYQQKKYFPYGSGYHGDQYSYGELSSIISQHLITKLCLD